MIIDAPGTHACLAAWEQPSQVKLSDRERRFEVMWSFEPEVVRTATEVATDLLWKLAPDVAQRLPEPEPDVTVGAEELRFAAALCQRIVGYLGTLVANGSAPRSVPSPLAASGRGA